MTKIGELETELATLKDRAAKTAARVSEEHRRRQLMQALGRGYDGQAVLCIRYSTSTKPKEISLTPAELFKYLRDQGWEGGEKDD